MILDGVRGKWYIFIQSGIADYMRKDLFDERM
jgi:hypothetical protein